MKITIISPVFPYPKKGIYVGIERHVYEYSKALLKEGHEVSVITTFWNGGKDWEEFEGVNIYRAPDISLRFGRVGRLFDLHYYTWGKNLLKLENLFKADVVHSLAPVSSARDIKIPLISHFHHYESIDRPVEILYKPFHHLIEKAAYSNSDLVVTPSEFSKKTLCEAFGLLEDKVKVVPHGVDITRFVVKEKRFEGIQLLFVGGLEERKGVKYLIEALGPVIDSHSAVELTVVGSGVQESKLRELTRELNLERRVKFTGHVDEVTEYYNSADIFVFPSSKEGFGMVLIEAMACGLPIISTNASAIPEVVGSAGILVEPRNSEALADAIIKLIESRELREELGRKGRKRVEENFTWEKVVQKMIEVYKEVIRSKP
jgi:glycosyltransferase involved in cell wall biosynthesis